MSAFSRIAFFTAGLAAVASASIQVPGGSDPTGPAVYQPGLASVVPAGIPFSITWSTDKSSDCGETVDLVLLHGASAATMQAISYIATKADNNGTYAWTPSKDLAPSESDTGYGIELICSKNNAYQYTDQFGISNANYVASAASSSPSSGSASSSPQASASSSPKASSTKVQPVYTTEVVTSFETYCPAATQFVVNNKTHTVSSAQTVTITDCPCTITKAANQSVVAPVTGYAGNSSVIRATGNVTVPSSLKTTTAAVTSAIATAGSGSGSNSSSTRSAASAAQTGSAANVGASLAGLVIAAGVAVLAL